MLTTSIIFAGVVLTTAQPDPLQFHIVREGENLTTISRKHDLGTAIVAKHNPFIPDPLPIGAVVYLPNQTSRQLLAQQRSESQQSVQQGSGAYVVRNGENDWTIARKFGIKPSELRAMNPGVDWTKLQIGATLNVPTTQVVGTTVSNTQQAQATTASNTQTSEYVVREGDNDWKIAQRFGIRPSQLHALNPGVNWPRLQIGQKINVPRGSGNANTSTTGNVGSVTRVAVDKNNVSIRSGASTSRPRIAMVNRGQMARVLDRLNGWYKLEFSNGTVGWVRHDMVKPATAQPAARPANTNTSRPANNNAAVARSNTSAPAPNPTVGRSVIETAMSHIGIRYRYGGTSRSTGFDCSGFVFTVYSHHGVRLPRTSIQQSQHGAAVNRGDLVAGDLVFFRTNRGTRINHVGIYIGNGRFVHASSAGGSVRTDSLNSGYYQRTYAGARRVTGARATAAPAPASNTASQSTTRTTSTQTEERIAQDAVVPPLSDTERQEAERAAQSAPAATPPASAPPTNVGR